MPYRTIKQILIFALSSSLTLQASGVDFYDVEILAFRQIDTRSYKEKLDLPTARHLNLNVELNSLLSKGPTISLEPAIEGYLTDSAARIAANGNYEILFHGRWSQTTSDRKAAPYIGIDLRQIGQNQSLRGVLRLFSTDLLYIDVLLRYQPKEKHTADQNLVLNPRIARPYYFLKERRRVRFREIHFLDHPKFGILLTVWPIELPKFVPLISKPLSNTSNNVLATP